MKLLIIEDEKKVAEFLAKGLRETGYTVVTMNDGSSGLQEALEGSYDLIVLDVMLPGKDGFEILEEIRSAGRDSRVLMLTALDSKEHTIRGLNLGADDYLNKPFDFQELQARIRALLRRGPVEQRDILSVGDLELDRTSQQVTRSGATLELTRREFLLLQFLMDHAGEIVTRNMIGQQVWNLGYESGSNVIDVYINYLRRKVDGDYEHKLIQTVRGRGYMLTDAP